MTGKRAAIYVRISQDRTGAGLGVARQEKDCRALVKGKGWTLAGVYADNDTSAYSGKPRPEYARLVKDIEAGRVDAVVAWHTDRLHRSPKELEAYVDLLNRREVPTHTVKAGELDLSTPSGRMIARTLGAMARYESEHKSERIKARNQQRAEAGQPIGGPRPFGYEPGGMVVRESEAEVVREITTRVIGGDSLASIIRDLNDRGIRSTRGNEWRYSSLRELLLRPRNAGLLQWQGEVVGAATWPAIVTEAELLAVERILKDPSRRTTTGNTRKHLMSGLVRCSECGKGMKPGGWTDRQGRKWQNYRCHSYRSTRKVDDFVSRVTLMILADVRVRHALAKTADIDLSKMEKERDQITDRLDDAANAYAEGTITLAQLNTITSKLRDRQKAIESDLASTATATVFGDMLTEEDVEARWETLTIERKRAIIDALMIVTVHPVGRRGRGPQPVSKGVKIEFRTTGSNIIGGPMPKDLLRKIVSAFD